MHTKNINEGLEVRLVFFHLYIFLSFLVSSSLWLSSLFISKWLDENINDRSVLHFFCIHLWICHWLWGVFSSNLLLSLSLSCFSRATRTWEDTFQDLLPREIVSIKKSAKEVPIRLLNSLGVSLFSIASVPSVVLTCDALKSLILLCQRNFSCLSSFMSVAYWVSLWWKREHSLKYLIQFFALLGRRILKDLSALIFSFHHHPSISSEQFIASCSDPLTVRCCCCSSSSLVFSSLNGLLCLNRL